MKQDSRLGFRRRLLLLALILCAAALATWSLGALASRNPQPPVTSPPVSSPPAMAPGAVTPQRPTLAAAKATPPPTPTPTPTLDFTLAAPLADPAAEDYFSDAVFIGDSRTDGLRLYSGIRGADFLAYKALMVFEVTGTHNINQKKIPVGGEKRTVLDALGDKQYGKIYIMLGINELGWNKSSDFGEAFRTLIDEVRALQPNAVVYIESLIPINPAKAKAGGAASYINNEKIAVYNDILRQVCADKQAVFLDLADGLTGGQEDLPPEGTTDGIHFVKSYYVKWLEYLQTHTVDADAYFASQITEEGTPDA